VAAPCSSRIVTARLNVERDQHSARAGGLSI
jgi:hypothetical protein